MTAAGIIPHGMRSVALIGTASSDAGRHAVLFARLPEHLADEQRREKYDEPFTAMIREAGIGTFLRGFSQTNDDGAVQWIGLEAELATFQDCGLIVAWLIELGASLETVVEIDTENSSYVQFRLGETMAR
jgi:hypothetical protein